MNLNPEIEGQPISNEYFNLIIEQVTKEIHSMVGQAMAIHKAECGVPQHVLMQQSFNDEIKRECIIIASSVISKCEIKKKTFLPRDIMKAAFLRCVEIVSQPIAPYIDPKSN